MIEEFMTELMKGNPLAILVVVVVFLTLVGLGYLAWWHLIFKYVYTETMFDEAVVTNMDYDPPYTTTTYIRTGKNSGHYSTIHHPAKHHVYFEGKKTGKWSFNKERLYQTVRLDDEIKIEYREKYRVRKDNPRDRRFEGNVCDVVITPKDRRVEL